MGCFELYKGYDEEGIFTIMSKEKKHKKEKAEKSFSLKRWIKAHGSEIAASLITAAICAIGSSVFSYVQALPTLNTLTAKVDALSTEIDEMQTLVAQNSTEIANINTELGNINNQISELNGFKDTVLSIPSLYFNADKGNTDFIEQASVEANAVPLVATGQMNANTYIGTDADGINYTAGEWVEELILISYQEDGREVYFLGQYNENYHWDGYCVTNVYNADGTLYGICESNFDNGTRIDYKTLYSTNDGEWIYTNRVCGETANSGESVRCTIENDTVKNFTSTNVRITDILYADDYAASMNATIIQYYNGNTVDKLFEDNTGDAYFVKFDEDGTVKTLYVGQFSDGKFNDNTGNAWDIAYAEEGGFYVCNTGNFKNGNAVTPSTEPISLEEIEAIVAGYDFNCELKWKE